MILFLVVMVVSLTSISQQSIEIKTQMEKIKSEKVEPVEVVKKPEPERPEAQEVDPIKLMQLQRLTEIRSVCDRLNHSTAAYGVGARVDCQQNSIDLGEAGRFDAGKYELNVQGRAALRRLIPVVLQVAESPIGMKWLKRVHQG